MAMRKLKKYIPTKFKAKKSVYDKDAADYAVNFIQALCHTKGTWAGKPFELIDWQEQIIRDLFGTLKPNGYRQFNMAYIEIPKKQGKLLALDTPSPTPASPLWKKSRLVMRSLTRKVKIARELHRPISEVLEYPTTEFNYWAVVFQEEYY